MNVMEAIKQTGTRFTMFGNNDYSATVTGIATHGQAGNKWEAIHYTLDINGKRGWFKLDTIEASIKTYNIALVN